MTADKSPLSISAVISGISARSNNLTNVRFNSANGSFPGKMGSKMHQLLCSNTGIKPARTTEDLPLPEAPIIGIKLA